MSTCIHTECMCPYTVSVPALMSASVSLETLGNSCRGSDGMSDRDPVRDVRQVVADHRDLRLEPYTPNRKLRRLWIRGLSWGFMRVQAP